MYIKNYISRIALLASVVAMPYLAANSAFTADQPTSQNQEQWVAGRGDRIGGGGRGTEWRGGRGDVNRDVNRNWNGSRGSFEHNYYNRDFDRGMYGGGVGVYGGVYGAPGVNVYPQNQVFYPSYPGQNNTYYQNNPNYYVPPGG